MKRLLLFSFFLTFFSCVSCKDIIESYAPKVFVNSVSFNSVSADGFGIDVYYLVKNYKIKENIKLFKRNYSFYIGDEKVSTVNNNKTVKIPGNKTFLFKERYKIAYEVFFNAIKSSLNEGKINMRLEGFLFFNTSIGKVKAPIEKIKTIKFPSIPNFSIKDVKISGPSKLAVFALLKNKSSDPLEIKRANFKLYVGNTEISTCKSENIYIEPKSGKEFIIDVFINVEASARLIVNLGKIKKAKFRLKGYYVLKTSAGEIKVPLDI